MHFLSRDRNFYKQFFSMLFFIAGQNLIVFSVNLADNVMLGNFSENALSGVALANQVQFLLQMVVNGVGEGVVVIASQYWGKRETEPIRHVTGIGMRVAMVTGVIFLLAGLLIPEFILGLLSTDQAIIAEGVKYMRIISFSYLVFCMSSVLLATMRSVENVRIGMAVSSSALVINVFLNYCLIFGRFGFPRLGVEGAALATLIARTAELVIVMVYAARVDKKLGMKMKDLLSSSAAIVRDYKKHATPVILSGFSWGVAMFMQTAVLGRMGSASVAANSIASSLFSVVSVVCYGSGNAASVYTGKLVGAGDLHKVRESTRTLQVIFLVIGALSGLMVYACRDLIISIYNVQPATQELARQFITVLAVTIVGTSYQVACLTGIVRGGGHTKFVFYNDLIFMWGLVLPLSFMGAFVWKLSPAVVFIFLKCDQILKCFVAVVEVNSYRWIKKLTRDAAKAA